MKKLLLTFAALPMALCAGQASAQTGGYSSGANVQNRIANLEGRFNAGVQAGNFTRSERSAIARQIADLRSLERSYSYDGLSEPERRALQERIRAVRDQLRMAGGTEWANRYRWSDRDLDGYANAHGNGASYDAYGRPIPNGGLAYDQYGRAIPNGGVAYDQYGRALPNHGVVYDEYGRPVARTVPTDQYGRPIGNGYAGQGGPYEPVRQGNGVGNIIGGVLGSVMGGGNMLGGLVGGGGGLLGSILGGGGLRSGDLITGTIGSVLGSAMNFGPQYRDNNQVYYRSDGQRVYEIDARTNRVVRIHPVRR